MKLIAASSVGFSGGCSKFIKMSGRNHKKQNVIFILSDDQGYCQLGCYGDQFNADNIYPISIEESKRWGYSIPKAIEAAKNCTPNIDNLAKQGMRMLNAHAAPSCVPSRASFITGRYPQKFGIYDNGDIYKDGLPDNAVSLVKLLSQGGYRTGLIGKWHLGQCDTEAFLQGREEERAFSEGKHPLDQGFDYFFGFDRAETTYYESPHLWRNREFGVKAQGYITEQFTDEAINFIDNCTSADKPFFLFLSYNAPHNPISTPPQQYCRFELGGNKWVDDVYNTIFAMDCGVGRVIDAIRDKGIEQDTLVIFASDNGASWNYPVPANGMLRGYKRQFYEGGQRVPMIFRQPGKIPAGVDCDQMVSIMDIIPTALDMAQSKIPKSLDIDGISLRQLLYNGEDLPDERVLYWAGPMGTDSTAEHRANFKRARAEGVSVWNYNKPGWFIIKNNWKLTDTGNGEVKLFNLADDIGENNDLSRQNPDIVKKLMRSYVGWRKSLPKPVVWDIKLWEATVPQDKE